MTVTESPTLRSWGEATLVMATPVTPEAGVTVNVPDEPVLPAAVVTEVTVNVVDVDAL